MQVMLGIVQRLSKFMQVIAGTALTFIMLLTVADVVLRTFKKPIVGTYEIVSLGGAVIIGFAIPITSWLRGHIFVDFFIQRFSKKTVAVINIITRCVGITLFILIAWNMFKMGFDLYETGEVTQTRRLPFYPIVYGLGICCLVQCIVLICDIVKVIGGEYE
ncbi:MAG: TRAP transporter small permease [Proteobacteria bacterium]|nr:TRAP transporter small permease [Pseudomonadota bacterium]